MNEPFVVISIIYVVLQFLALSVAVGRIIAKLNRIENALGLPYHTWPKTERPAAPQA
jgi:hypothetical protein